MRFSTMGADYFLLAMIVTVCVPDIVDPLVVRKNDRERCRRR